MDFSFSEEQEELRKVVRSFLAAHSAETDVRRISEGAEGYDRQVWRRMAGELGLQGLAVPEEYGGAGFGYPELGVVFEEMGRALLCAPYFSSVALAAEVLLRSGDELAAKDLLPGICAGTTVATLALTEESGLWTEDGVSLSAARTGDGWTLSGVKTYVPDGHLADLLLVVARGQNGVSLFAVDATAPGLTRTRLPTLDQTREQARLEFEGTPARLIGSSGTAWPVIERALATAGILLAAEQVGSAASTLATAVEYAKARVQYGRPIGSFQGIKHLCADLLTELESARSAAYGGLWALQSGDEQEIRVAAALAQVYCSETFTRVAAGSIQVHGAIGFTWEHPAHLYFKRAKSTEVLLGSPAHHRELLAAALGL
ncbi:acyl-CoA dehydrogenase family protein [Streptomyces gilvus]|uniref:acyl-CoA dehydrogenase family protein n=1 Tax=Streptomyces gilvus TaxID=2920937 RepID=UPI001F0D1FAA|nr:acyl-CoA dehydrogenase family protein [Streptomyces sp. CME 23]MCH5675580.1 acyl-CoA/acyl-ACP dehydrogenase [Streptomyces sp. CME 23]